MNKRELWIVAVLVVAMLFLIFYKNPSADNVPQNTGMPNTGVGVRCVPGDWPFCGCSPPDGGSCESEFNNTRCEDRSGRTMVWCDVYHNGDGEPFLCYCRDYEDGIPS